MSKLHVTPSRTASSTTTRSLGLSQSTALIVGSIIGVGIFSLPYSLASYGPISLVAMGLATVGAVALALMFAVMSAADAGRRRPYAYARAAFGNGLGFSNAWSYWITAWAGNAAIVVGWVFYVEHFVNKGGVDGWSIVIALVGPVDPGRDQPHRRPQHGRVPGLDHRPEVRPAGADGDRRACSSSSPATSRRGTPVATPTCRRSAARWRSACSATSASRPPPSPRQGAQPRAQHPDVPPSSAPSPAPSSTCCR